MIQMTSMLSTIEIHWKLFAHCLAIQPMLPILSTSPKESFPMLANHQGFTMRCGLESGGMTSRQVYAVVLEVRVD